MHVTEREEDRQTKCVQALLKSYWENIGNAAFVLELWFGLQESEKNEYIVGSNSPKCYESWISLFWVLCLFFYPLVRVSSGHRSSKTKWYLILCVVFKDHIFSFSPLVQQGPHISRHKMIKLNSFICYSDWLSKDVHVLDIYFGVVVCHLQDIMCNWRVLLLVLLLVSNYLQIIAVFFISSSKPAWAGCWRMSYSTTTSILWGADGLFPVTLSSHDLYWMLPNNTPDFLVSFLVSQLLINHILILIGNIFSLIWKMIERALTQASPPVLPNKTVWQNPLFKKSITLNSQIY